MATLRLTDGGLETSLTFDQGLELPAFAAFPLVETEDGRAALRAYFAPYLAVARDYGAGFVLDTPTWRANPDWAAQLGYDLDQVRAVNATAAAFARELAAEATDVTVEGVVGPRGDGYQVGVEMTANEATRYHGTQVSALAEAGVDQVAAVTFNYSAEAVGFLHAAGTVGIPAVVSFTLETDGRLPSGQSLRDAIGAVDDQTAGAAAGFMINCAHPSHFVDALVPGEWLDRITGVRANASTMSHAELDVAEELDEGDPDDLALRYRALLDRLPALSVLGGCCGTNDRHVRAIAEACLAA
jgi:S-methylmethionine-dependent homocysteine/selenocysteine methylase